MYLVVIQNHAGSTPVAHPERRWQNGYAAACKAVSLRQRWFNPIPAHVDDQTLPPEIEAIITKGIKEGVRFSVDHRNHHKITGIIWSPGDPNKLAECIIKQVTSEEMPLTLDRRKYMIRRVDDDYPMPETKR